MISKFIKLYAKSVLPNGYSDNGILFFANIRNTGIGNIVWLYPVMKALEKNNLTVVCDRKEIRELLEFNLPEAAVCSFDEIPRKQYGVSINNFLTQTRPNILKIISLRIPCRVGHTWKNSKYSWLFNERVETNDAMQEGKANARLLIPFALNPVNTKIKLPHIDKKYKTFDVLIQPHTSNEPRRNYPYYKEVIEQLNCRVGLIGSLHEWEYCEELTHATKAENLCGLSLLDTCHIMKDAVVVGNDGGLVKLAHAIGARALQISRKGSEYNLRSWIDGHTLVEPTVFQVLKNIERELRR